MHDVRALEAFFTQYMPGVKHIIEDYWINSREELASFLRDCLICGVGDSWMGPYFSDLLAHTESAPHSYTNPWQVL